MQLPTRSLVLALAAMVCAADAASGQQWDNRNRITIPAAATDGRAVPYPSTIEVIGAGSTIFNIQVTLNALSHAWVSDVRVLLVSPSGQRVVLMANTHGAGDAVNSVLTFAPDATATLPDTESNVVSGVYACSVYGPEGNFPGPAPFGPYSNSLVSLIGTNPNGVWSLYVWDDFPASDGGEIAEGWTMVLNEAPSVVPVARAFNYQGKITANGAPLNGAANVRFSLNGNPATAAAISGIGAPVTRSFTAIEDGLISTTLDFGPGIDANQALWLNIEVESPPGSGFVNLTPRQPIMPAPQARVAQRAVIADSATNAINATNAANATSATTVPWSGVTGAPANLSPWANISTGIAYVGGSVGINTTTPLARLHIRGASAVAGVAPTNGSLVAFENLSGGYFNFLCGDAFESGLLFGKPSGSSADCGIIYNNPSNPSGLEFRAGGNTPRVYIRANGAVGIGTASPDQLLTVAGNASKPGGGAWSVLSDPRAKHDIAPLAGTLDKLLTLRGYSFLYNDDRVASGQARPGTQIGLMADEVARVFPDWVSTDAAGTRFVTERATTALMVEALRDLRAEKDAVAAKAEAAEKKVEDLQRRLEALERLVNDKASQRP